MTLLGTAIRQGTGCSSNALISVPINNDLEYMRSCLLELWRWKKMTCLARLAAGVGDCK